MADNLVTKDYLDARLREFKQELKTEIVQEITEAINQRFSEVINAMMKLNKAMIEDELRPIRKELAELRMEIAEMKLENKEVKAYIEHALDTWRIELMKVKEDVGILKRKVLG
ncbi:hypothetical protein [Calditerricola satsumensis]|uniref:Uncharacterized protein n=1 Tax=Calditerricola satsumensis TaxID=373054 RepID=A0A8J3BGS0_9BACI|nr:hypothetical protein [Calditerricola satsumensis]GGK08172.1 hypothetical protein GCM10007043_22800 [Calditerricola satsumensis]